MVQLLPFIVYNCPFLNLSSLYSIVVYASLQAYCSLFSILLCLICQLTFVRNLYIFATMQQRAGGNLAGLNCELHVQANGQTRNCPAILWSGRLLLRM